jgi:hypothetical protein
MPTISENLQRLVSSKNNISDAIIAKGGTVASGDGFEEFPADISTIPSGGGEIPKQITTFPVLDDRKSRSQAWAVKTWPGLTSLYGVYVWADGDNIYYSSSSTQYVLDKSTSTWTSKTWSGLTSFSGDYVWTDGDNVYYSDPSYQYILNKQSKPTILTTSAKPKFN